MAAPDPTDPPTGVEPVEPHAVPLDLPELATVVVARTAHDAVGVAGGLIARQRARGVEVTVLDVGRADADEPGTHCDASLSLLGVDTVTDLGISRLDDVPAIAAMAEAITSVEHCDLIVAPWAGGLDAAPDAAAVARAAQWAAARRGAALLFGIPPATARGMPPALRGQRLLRLDLDEDCRDRWRQALGPPAQGSSGEGVSAEFFLTPSSPIAGGNAPSRAPGLATGVPPVTAGRSGIET